jgi:hypothetical protein
VDRLSGDNTWSFKLNSLSLVSVDWAVAVNGVAESVDDSAEHGHTNRHINDGSGSFDDITFLDFSVSGY